MRALRFHEFGPPSVLRVDDVARPEPTPGALIHVTHGGFNFADTERRRGLYLREQPLPDILGFEGAGVVERGPVDLVGRRVAFMAPRAHAEWVEAPLENLVVLPDSLSNEQGAAMLVQGLSTFHTLFTQGRLVAGEWVAVLSAAGGVGLLAVQWAKLVGAKVVGVVSSDAKRAAVLSAGADAVVLRDTDWARRVVEASGGGVNLLLDAVGASVAAAVPHALEPFGRWVRFGEASGAPPPLAMETLFEKSLTVSSWWLRSRHPAGERARATQQLVSLISAGSLRLELGGRFTLENAGAAHEALESGQSIGKLVLEMEQA